MLTFKILLNLFIPYHKLRFNFKNVFFFFFTGEFEYHISISFNMIFFHLECFPCIIFGLKFVLEFLKYNKFDMPIHFFQVLLEVLSFTSDTSQHSLYSFSDTSTTKFQFNFLYCSQNKSYIKL